MTKPKASSKTAPAVQKTTGKRVPSRQAGAWRRLQSFVASPTARLAGTYLIIILVMSLAFSFVIYNTSSHELGRQIPPDSFFRGNGQTGGMAAVQADGSVVQNGFDSSRPAINQFLQTRIGEARHALIMRLVYLNIAVLVGGMLLSYYLSRRTLRPIEDAMEAQVQFVSDASHELRTPLTAIQTSNEVALRKPKLSAAEARKLIEQNTDDIKRLKTLSDGLLNLAQHRKTDTIVGPVALQDAASDAMTLVVAQASAKAITVEDKVAALTVIADKSVLTQALVILLDNAIKYSKPDGTVYLETRVKGKSIYFDVRDKGIGIRASDMPHLFRRFYRADNARSGGEHGGYGLGLAIARQITTSIHGEISVTSTLGKGSTFTIKLPAA